MPVRLRLLSLRGRLMVPFLSILHGTAVGFHPNEGEMIGEILRASDIEVTGVFLRGEAEAGGGTVDASVGVETISLDYQPNPRVDVVRRQVSLREYTQSARIGFGKAASEFVEWSVAGMCRSGFGDFASVWVDEYFRQQFGTFPEYRTASPRVVSAEAAVRWEAVPANVFAEATLVAARERIAPGYHRDFAAGGVLTRENDRFDSLSLSVTVESFLSRRVRMRHSLLASAVSPRAPRYAYAGEYIWAVSRDWTSRGSLQATTDGTRFQAISLRQTLRREWRKGWWTGISGRFYADNGRLDESLAVFAAAPPALTSLEGLLHVHRETRRTFFGLSAGPYLTRYADPETEIAPFLHLFADRDWWRMRAVFARRF